MKLKLYSGKEFITESTVMDGKYQLSFKTDSNPEKIWTLIESIEKKEIFTENKIKEIQGLQCNRLTSLDLEV